MRQIGIERHSRVMRYSILIAVGLLAVIYLLARLRIGLPGTTFEARAAPGTATPAWLGDVTMLLLLAAIWPLQRMLRRIEAGDAFSVATVGDFRAFSAWLLALSLVRAVVPSLFAQAQARGAPIALALDIRDLLLLMVTLILFLVARLFERARMAEQDVAEIV